MGFRQVIGEADRECTKEEGRVACPDVGKTELLQT